MQKQYIAIYNYKKYSLDEIMNMIQPYKVKYWHRKETRFTPEEENIDYKIDISPEFDKAVKIACVEFEDDYDEFGKYVQFDEDFKFKIVQEGYSWLDLLQSYGWDTFYDIKKLEDFYNEEQKVRVQIENWIDTIAENNAWQKIYEGEERI